MKKLLIITFLYFIAHQSFACSCTAKPSVETNWKSADDIFIGKIIRLDTSNYGNYGNKIYIYTLEITKSFKNELYPQREKRSILSGGSCDYMFDVGKTYLIYSKTESATLTSSICSRTDLLENIDTDELGLLEKLRKTYSNMDIVKSQSNFSYQSELLKNSYQEKLNSKNLLIYILSSTKLFLIIIIIFLVKRKKSY